MSNEQPRQTSPAYAGLPIFRSAMDFAVAIDNATAQFSRRHRYGIGEELRRASLKWPQAEKLAASRGSAAPTMGRARAGAAAVCGANRRMTMKTIATRVARCVGLGLVAVSVLAPLGASLVPATALAKAATGRFLVSGDGEVVTDTRTKLEWQRNVVAGKNTWNDAKTYCDALVLSGKSDWRLPWVRELSSIVDKKESNPSIDTDAFPNTPAYFWSASLRAGSSSNAWYVVFTVGYVNNGGVSYALEVRCVRGS